MTASTIEWRRLFIEGVVIVVSILLAFAIDAWWDEQQAAEDAEDQVARVVAELQANITILRLQEERLSVAIVAAQEFLALTGPEPEEVSAREIGSLLGRMYSVPTMSLQHTAVNNFLSSGQLTKGAWLEIRLALTDMLSSSASAQFSSLELRGGRPDLLRQMQQHVSGVDLVRDHAYAQHYPPSRFESNTVALLSDILFEGYLANNAIRLEINRGNVQILLELHEDVLDAINEAL